MSQSRPQVLPSTVHPTYAAVTDPWGQCEAPAPFNLSAIGATLRETREEKGIPVVRAAQDLFVKKSTLNAIESGQWVSLPHPVYVKGYVRSYASYLGILGAVESDLSEYVQSREARGDYGRVHGSRGGRKPSTNSRRLFLPRIALVCSSIAGVLLALAVSSGMQSPVMVTLKDLFVGCHLAVADLRRIILP